MNCPRCEASELMERERDGIVLDVCSSCRGLWLDRGELEKLIARATRDSDEPAPRRDYDPLRGGHYRDDDKSHAHQRPHRKRGWLETLGDVFD
jgi:uncharacterized protein